MEVSIIMPIYNKAKYLETVLEQIKSQTYTDFECILIDDGSFDGSEIICDDFCKLDKRFKVLHLINGGVSHARNVGLNIAQGKYITFVDADDEIHERYIENLYLCISNNSVDMVITSSIKFWDDTDKTECIDTPYNGVVKKNRFLSEFAEIQYHNGIYGFCWGKMFSKRLVENVRFNEKIRLAEDLDFYLSIYPFIESIYFDSHHYHYYRQNAQNSSMQMDDSKIDYFTQLEIQIKLYHMLMSRSFLFGNNEKLVTNRIYDYVFFNIFHTDLKNLESVCLKMNNLNLPNYRYYIEDNHKKRVVLFLFKKKKYWIIFYGLTIYRWIKRGWNRL